MTENNNNPRRRKEIMTNELIRKIYCGSCAIFSDLDRTNTGKETNDCISCYSGLRAGRDMEYILKKYKVEVK